MLATILRLKEIVLHNRNLNSLMTGHYQKMVNHSIHS